MEKTKVIEILQEMAAGKADWGIIITRRRQDALKAAVEIMLLDEERLASADRMVKMSAAELTARRSAEEVLAEAEAMRERSSRNVKNAYALLEDVERHNSRCTALLDEAKFDLLESKKYLERSGKRLMIQLIVLTVRIGVFIAMIKLL